MGQINGDFFKLEYAKSKTIKNSGNITINRILDALLQKKIDILNTNPHIRNEILNILSILENNEGKLLCNNIEYIIENIKDHTTKGNIFTIKKNIEDNFRISYKIKKLKKSAGSLQEGEALIKKYDVQPNIITVSSLITLAGSLQEGEALIKKYDVQPNIITYKIFFNLGFKISLLYSKYDKEIMTNLEKYLFYISNLGGKNEAISYQHYYSILQKKSNLTLEKRIIIQKEINNIVMNNFRKELKRSEIKLKNQNNEKYIQNMFSSLGNRSIYEKTQIVPINKQAYKAIFPYYKGDHKK